MGFTQIHKRLNMVKKGFSTEQIRILEKLYIQLFHLYDTNFCSFQLHKNPPLFGISPILGAFTRNK